MKHFSLQLKAVSPLAIRSDHAPAGVETAKYISGTTLAGSLAAVHRALRPLEAKEFKDLFLSDQISYPDLYPAVFKQTEDVIFDPTIYPIPKTAQSCKRHQGFLFPQNDKDDKERHGVRDSLLDWAMFKLLENGKGNVAPIEVLRRYKYCTYEEMDGPCNGTMDHFGGYYRREIFEPYRMISASTDSHTRLQMHTGINRVTGTVQERILYSREMFEEDMEFWGRIKTVENEELISHLTDFIEEIALEGLVRIGTGRTRGMGKVSLTLDPGEVEQEERFNAFKERLAAFNEELQKQAVFFGTDNLQPFYFALTLHSPLILCDPQLRYQCSIDGTTLAEHARISSSAFKLVYSASSVRRMMGWSELWGTPRASEYATETGSVFLYSCSPALDETALHSLFELEEQGMGRRRAEGFGRIYFSDPFHLEVKLR